MKKIILYFIYLIMAVSTNAQEPNMEWVKTIGNKSVSDWETSKSGYGEGRDIVTDKSGNVYSIGEFRGTIDFDPGEGIYNMTSLREEASDLYISKLDIQGNFLWTKQLSVSGESITLDALGNIYITGKFKGICDFDPGVRKFNLTSESSGVFILKLNSLGNFLWAKNFGGTSGDYGSSIAIDTLGNILLTGAFEGASDFDPSARVFTLVPVSIADIFISKLDSSGNFLWANNLGIVMDDFGPSVVLDASGNAYLSSLGTDDFDQSTGKINPPANNKSDHYLDFHLFVLKFDAFGNSIWTLKVEKLLYRQDEFHPNIAIDKFKNIYTMGAFIGTVKFDSASNKFNITAAGKKDIFILKLSQPKISKK